MGKYHYAVQVLKLQEIHELPGAWPKESLQGLLNHIEYDGVDDIGDEDLKEMTGMALSDLDVEEGALKLLEYRLDDRLNSGQRQNLSEALKEDRIWEEYSELSLHEELFNISCMLYWAYPKYFSTPDIVTIELELAALSKEAEINLIDPTASFIARILNDGMDARNIMRRLYGDSLASNSFPEAEHIIWQLEAGNFNAETKSNTVTLYTSWNWVDELKGVKSYESKAFSDGQLN